MFYTFVFHHLYVLSLNFKEINNVRFVSEESGQCSNVDTVLQFYALSVSTTCDLINFFVITIWLFHVRYN